MAAHVHTTNWLGFHAALVGCAAWFWWQDRSPERWRLAVWAGLSLAAVALGWRFFPRYYFQLLPVAARGFTQLGKWRVAVLVVLLIPLVRFGPRYPLLALEVAQGRSHNWLDVAMDKDSREAAGAVRGLAQPGDTLFVWGYRPEILVYAGLPAATRFLDSQPLTGVFADRHLVHYRPSILSWTAAHHNELARSKPTFVLDGLGLYNPYLALTAYPDLTGWIINYEPVARTTFTVIYKRREGR